MVEVSPTLSHICRFRRCLAPTMQTIWIFVVVLYSSCTPRVPYIELFLPLSTDVEWVSDCVVLYAYSVLMNTHIVIHILMQMTMLIVLEHLWVSRSMGPLLRDVPIYCNF